MIKCSINEEMRISGGIAQIAVELEDTLRSVRTAFCDALGEETGNALLEERIKNSRMSVEEVARKGELATKEMRKNDPEGAAFIEAQVKEFLKRL